MGSLPRNRRRRGVLLLGAGLVAIVVLLAPGALDAAARRTVPDATFAPPSPTTGAAAATTPGAPLPPPPWGPGTGHVIFDAGFAGTAPDPTAPDPTVWTTCYPWARRSTGCTNDGNRESEWYLPGQDQVTGGALHLVASEIPTMGRASDGAPAIYPWRSGMVTTWHHADFTYGFVEVRAAVPSGRGLWPALWLLPANRTWPPEIDMVEGAGTEPFSALVTFHPKGAPLRQSTLPWPALSTGYHVYAVDWEPKSITWYVDGQTVFSVTGRVPHRPMYFLADLAVYGSPPLAPDATTPATDSLDIGRVTVWQH